MRLMILALLFGTATVAADLSDDLKTCAAMADAASRLACFDALGRATESNEDSDSEQRSEPVPAKPPEQPADSVPAPNAADDFGLDSMTAREREQREKEMQRAAAADRKLAEKERKAQEKAARKAEKERKKREREASVSATITRVVTHQDDRFSVTLDNGQTWRETQGSRVGIPEVGATVELKRGRFGGYRMNIDGIVRTAWVKRTN